MLSLNLFPFNIDEYFCCLCIPILSMHYSNICIMSMLGQPLIFQNMLYIIKMLNYICCSLSLMTFLKLTDLESQWFFVQILKLNIEIRAKI